jgi:DNA-binding CsgD family transcriptional regulator
VLRDQPFPLLLAQACEAAASEEAVGMLEEALHIYEGLGAARDAARAEARLRSLGVRRGPRGRHRRARHGWGSLTSTELAVVSLVAEGLTNREAGQRLFISPRTVETHVSHVFTKLGLTSRAALKAEATRRVEQPQTS